MSAGRPALLACSVLLLGLAAPPAAGFALFPDRGSGDPLAMLQGATRWASEPIAAVGSRGLHDGLQVAVDPGFADAFELETPEELMQLEQAVVAALDAWENPVLRFDLTFDGPTGEGTGLGQGLEIDLFAVPDSHPVFQGTTFFGLTFVQDVFVSDRLLSNGQRFDGRVMRGADVYINVTRVLDFRRVLNLPPELEQAAITRLLMHEFGHAIGLGHPNEGVNYDQDGDPFNPMPIDPADPFAGIGVSSAFDIDAIMSNNSLDGLFFTSLGADDRGGRDVLYPVPEASLAGLVLALALAAARRARPDQSRRRAAVSASTRFSG